MTDVANSPEFEQLVRDRAYALWESEGRPAGRDAEHWRASLEATVAELSASAPKPRKAKAAPRKKAAASKRAAAVLGEMLAAI